MSASLRDDDCVYVLPEMSRSVHVWRDALSLWRAYRLFTRLKPDIVHTHAAKAGLIGRLAARAAGAQVIIHTYHGNVFTGYFSKMHSALVRWCERRLASLTDCICVLSNEQRDEVTVRFGIARPSKVRVVPLGVDFERFSRAAMPPQDGLLTVGWIGRLVPIKNIHLFVAAAEETLRRGARVRFLVAGEGPDREVLEQAMARLGRESFTWLGWQEDVNELIRQCHVLVQTSRNEGTPSSLIQGNAVGRPFVSTRVGGVVDMVAGPLLRAGTGCQWYANAVLVEPDVGVLSSVLCELAERPEQVRGMGEAAAQFVRSHFDGETQLRALDSLYRDLLNRKALKGRPVERSESVHSCTP